MTTHKGVAEIVSRFDERLDEVVERSQDAIWQVIASYGRSGEWMQEDVREAVRINVGSLAQVLRQGREIKREELERIERVGGRRAEQGIPLDDVLHAYRTVSRVCWDVLADECRAQPGEALDATIDLAEAVLRYTDQISTAVAQAYAKAQRRIVREQEGARREFLSELLYGSDTAPEALLQRAHAFGYDLSLGYLALVGLGPEGDDGREASVIAATSGAGLSVADPIVLQKAEHTIALLPTDPGLDTVTVPEKIAAELGGSWRFGVGGPELGLEGIRKAYLEAKEALEIGLGLGLAGHVFRFDDLLLYHFLRVDPALVGRFVEQMLGPLIEYDERRKGELLKTLECYFKADGSVKLAGELLFAHPHTVTYRLKQIERLTGWSLRDPEDKLRLQVALQASRLH
ncbi:MAG: PucR family transcriptional regulator [Actinomycetota bacterium]